MCCIIVRTPQNRKELKMSNVQITAKNSEQMEIFRTQGHENWVRLEYSISLIDSVPACCPWSVGFGSGPHRCIWEMLKIVHTAAIIFYTLKTEFDGNCMKCYYFIVHKKICYS